MSTRPADSFVAPRSVPPFGADVGGSPAGTLASQNVVVNSCGCNVTWPVSTSAGNVGVQTATLNWYVTRTLANDGPVQIEAVFTNSSNGTVTTPAVTVTLNRIGTGADYGTTQAGPVTVGLQSGNAAISATDVDISGTISPTVFPAVLVSRSRRPGTGRRR